MKFSTYLLLSFCLATKLVLGQSFRNFVEKDGAPQAPVLGIAQDKQGFMWFASTQGLYRYDSRTFKKYGHDNKDAGSISSDYVEKVYVDKKGRLWVANETGLNLYNRQNDSFLRLSHNPKDPRSMPIYDRVKGITEDKDNNLWVATSFGINRIVFEGDSVRVIREVADFPHSLQSVIADPDGGLWVGAANGLFRFKDHKMMPVAHTTAAANEQRFDVRDLNIGKDRALWLATNRGLIKMDRKTLAWYLVGSLKRNDNMPSIVRIVADDNDKLWLATNSGLASFDPNSQRADWYLKDRLNPMAIADDSHTAVFIDKQRALWVGSYHAGISYLNSIVADFTRWPEASNTILMGRTSLGKLWGLRDKEIVLFDTDLSDVKVKLTLPVDVNYHSYFLDDSGTLWFAGDDNSINSIELKTGKLSKTLITKIKGGKIIPGMSIQKVYVDSGGQIWLSGNLLGLVRYDPRRKEFERMSTDLISSFTQDSKGNLWFAGMYNIHVLAGKAKKIRQVKVGGILKPDQSISARWLAEDQKGRIWATCKSGLMLYNKNEDDFQQHDDESQDLRSEHENLQIDSGGHLWMTSGYKLICYWADQKIVQTYDYRESLSTERRISDAFKDKKGNLFYTTNDGVFRLNSEKMLSVTGSLPLAFTSLKLFNKEVKLGDDTDILEKTIEMTKELTFKDDQNIFTIDFALLSYGRSEINRYAYYLKGFEKDWNYVQSPSATYTNLPSGSYMLMVKGVDAGGKWTNQPHSIKITVLPPWWKTWWAYLSYFLLITGVVYAVTRFLWMRSTFRRETALNQVKLDFFTNISHEIRTHLSLISGPLELAYEQLRRGESVETNLNYARDSSDRLLLIVNELLDFRKIQSGGVQLQIREHDILKNVKNVMAAFEHIGLEKQIQSSLLCPDLPVMLWYDISQMQKVLYNLLSNAYKFTPEGGKITVTVTEMAEQVSIAVADTGKGIPEQHLEKVFNYYYQADSQKPGYGIGLALSKSIVEMHHGTLSAQSKLSTTTQAGETTLTMMLLRGNLHFSDAQIADHTIAYAGAVAEETSFIPEIDNSKQLKKDNTILIIEDNDQLRVFIRELFEGQYNVLEAGNGTEGLAIAQEQMPDVIISDVMMPEMNGLEVCARLKKNAVTSHIPVVLLTAKSLNEQVIEGLQTGADDYLIKPFDPRVLVLKVKNLLRVRDEMKVKYRQAVYEDRSSGGSIAQDVNEAFINNLRVQVKANMSDADFGVNELAVNVGMSTSVLYRKMRSITSMTINEFVKSVRLSEAKILLESGVYNVNEVAMMVGFNDVKYFAKEFKKVFAKNPSEIRKELSE